MYASSGRKYLTFVSLLVLFVWLLATKAGSGAGNNGVAGVAGAPDCSCDPSLQAVAEIGRDLGGQ
jgi:hypothetical protein